MSAILSTFLLFLLVFISTYSEKVSQRFFSNSWERANMLEDRGSRARVIIIQRNSIMCTVNPTEIEQKFSFNKVSHLQSLKVKSTGLKCALTNPLLHKVQFLVPFRHSAVTVQCEVCEERRLWPEPDFSCLRCFKALKSQ